MKDMCIFMHCKMMKAHALAKLLLLFYSLQDLLCRLGSCLRGTIDSHLRNGGGDASSDFTELLGWIIRYFSEANDIIDMDEFPELF